MHAAVSAVYRVAVHAAVHAAAYLVVVHASVHPEVSHVAGKKRARSGQEAGKAMVHATLHGEVYPIM